MSTGYVLPLKGPGLSSTSPNNIRSTKRNITREKSRFVTPPFSEHSHDSIHIAPLIEVHAISQQCHNPMLILH